MFKSSRRKIVIAIMSILVLLWAGTLCVIYASSYYEVSNRNKRMLEEHVSMHTLRVPGHEMIIDRPPPNFNYGNMPVFKLSTFYSVAVSYEKKVLEIRNNENAVYTDDELSKLAFEIIDSGKTSGVKKNLIYRMADKNGYILIAFMDNTIMKESMTTLFRYTLIFGVVAIITFYFLAVYLAKRIVDPLEENYQKQKQFVSDAGHELKTPVSVIGANAEMLSREIGENKWLANIQYENERMGKLVNQLLELARTESVTIQTEKLDFSRLVYSEALPFESVAFERQISLNCHIAEGLFVNGNSVQLRQLISILLDNAASHSVNGKTIDLFLREEKGSVRFSVINDGEEIPVNQRAQLFERFYRTDLARNSDDNHYGLGLAIAKAIVTAHGGKIQVECFNGKIEFVVNIPIAKTNKPSM